MEQGTKQTLDDLLQMLQNWKKKDLTYYDPSGGNEWIWDDFIEKISEWMMPYVSRLFQCEHIGEFELESFRERVRGEIEDMRRLLRLPRPDEPRKVTSICDK